MYLNSSLYDDAVWQQLLGYTRNHFCIVFSLTTLRPAGRCDGNEWRARCCIRKKFIRLLFCAPGKVGQVHSNSQAIYYMETLDTECVWSSLKLHNLCNQAFPPPCWRKGNVTPMSSCLLTSLAGLWVWSCLQMTEREIERLCSSGYNSVQDFGTKSLGT